MQFKNCVTFTECCNTGSRHFLCMCISGKQPYSHNKQLFSFFLLQNTVICLWPVTIVWAQVWDCYALFLAQQIQVCQLTVWAGNKRARCLSLLPNAAFTFSLITDPITHIFLSHIPWTLIGSIRSDIYLIYLSWRAKHIPEIMEADAIRWTPGALYECGRFMWYGKCDKVL